MLLEVKDLVAGYDGSRVLNGVSLSVDSGESVAVLGRNGVGKTTLMESIMGLVRPTSGGVFIEGRDLARRPPNHLARAGVGIVPQGRRVFAPLTVMENLEIAVRKRGDWTVKSVIELMPRLGERRNNLGSQLSGGEQQMLAIGRALMQHPQLLLLDEPSMGLSPILVEQIFSIIKNINEQGTTVLLVEQNALMALAVANRGYVLQTGEVVLAGKARELLLNEGMKKAYLGET